MDLELHVYDENGDVVKTCTAQTPKIRFGTVRSLMKILKVDNVNDTAELLDTLDEAWEQVTGVLGQCFPEMQEDDWEYVDIKELIPIVVGILKSSFAEILSIPKDPKN